MPSLTFIALQPPCASRQDKAKKATQLDVSQRGPTGFLPLCESKRLSLEWPYQAIHMIDVYRTSRVAKETRSCLKAYECGICCEREATFQ